MTIRAAGIMLTAKDGRILFVKRGPGSDHPMEWAFPGGQLEQGETIEETARREFQEEIGRQAPKDLELWARRSAADEPNPIAVDYTTFRASIGDAFLPSLNYEHTGYCWAMPEDPPEPLHPGAAVSLAKLGWHELDIAKAMAAGQLTSPQIYHGLNLFSIRITGTGLAYRTAVDEFVYRTPDNFLTEEFCHRCAGLPVIHLHPQKRALLNSKEFEKRVVGSVMFAFIKGDEVWAIARINRDEAVKLMNERQISTSPGMRTTGVKVEGEDSRKLYLEGEPALLDHIAICEYGVWDKGLEPSGVESSFAGDLEMAVANQVRNDAEENGREEKTEDKARKDAEEKERKDRADRDARMDAAFSAMMDTSKRFDEMCGMMDSFGKRMDAFEAKDSARRDSEESEKKEEKEREDKARKDAEATEAKKKAEEEEKERDDKAREDAAIRDRLATVERMIPKQLSHAEIAEFAKIQRKANTVAREFGDSAERWLPGQTLIEYRRQLADVFKAHSPAWKDKDLTKLPDDYFDAAETAIYTDAATEGRKPRNIPGKLSEHVHVDEDTGLRTKKFEGDCEVWMKPFMLRSAYFTSFRPGLGVASGSGSN